LLLSLLLFRGSPLLADDTLHFAVNHQKAESIPPYRWYNHCSKVHRGFNAALYRRLATDLGLEPVLVETNLASKPIDLLALAIDKVMQQEADFTLVIPGLLPPYENSLMGKVQVLAIRSVIIFPKDQPSISDLVELEQLRGVAVNPDEVLKSFSDIAVTLSVKKVASLEKAIQALVSREGDYWITDKFMAQHLLTVNKLHNKLRLSTLEVGAQSGAYYMMSKDTPRNRSIMTEMDELLVNYRQKGYISRLKFSVMREWITDRSCSEPA
jgi:hypothetical protein